ncbi:MAG TPA: 16S rRNA (guanine(527)-N(7))-methyltransferase RsmG [Bacillales bacterium]|nr:16S rRNA (guanine(527)-N(7))-methyltransferase RsmG [Bacillales bacterium]
MEFTFQQQVEEKGINLSPQQFHQFEMYYETLIEWNEKMNLTAIVDRDAVFMKHFYDSLTLSFYYNFTRKLSLCDVGSGAGFPSIPLKICFPQLSVSIVDSLQKRTVFLQTLVDRLRLENVHIHHDRAEIFGQNRVYRESFDVATARAVAKLPVLCEYCLPLVKKDGHFLAMKGASVNAELEQSREAIATLGGRVEAVDALTLPGEQSKRHVITIAKEKETPAAFPRKPGTPNKRPL